MLPQLLPKAFHVGLDRQTDRWMYGDENEPSWKLDEKGKLTNCGTEAADVPEKLHSRETMRINELCALATSMCTMW